MPAESNPTATLPAPHARTAGTRPAGRAWQSPRREPPSQTENVRETADSIVVAFILAFVFRAFIIEAFVIPTGSMAATLYGRHGTMGCQDCGWEFAYGLSDPATRTREHPRYGPNDVAVCSNCNHRNAITEINDSKDNSEAGDRILALKWPYDIGGEWLGPHRWDVTLFKDPSDIDLNDGVTNFIKRLVGLPNEVLEIIDGDVYTAPVEKLSPAVRDALEQARHAKFLRHTAPGFESREAADLEKQLRTIWPGVLNELSRVLEIRRKTPLAQQALWCVVYDHDYPPHTWDADQPCWKPIDGAGDGWNVSGRKLSFQPEREEPAGIALLNRPVVDMIGYNIRAGGELCGVTDLRLRMVLTPLGNDGVLLLKLPKRERSFWAAIQSDGEVRLYMSPGSIPIGETPLATAKLSPLAPGTPITVDFQNVDYRVSLSLDGLECVSTTPEQWSPDIAKLRTLEPTTDRREVQILARGLSLELTHVVVERDVYYRSPRRDLRELAAISQLTGTVWGGTGNPIWLRDGEFFMLGDNSPASGDSRLWSVIGDHLAPRGEKCQLGTVPRDQLIGRAFFVYWPSGHRSDIIPVLDRIGLIPDVGRMRWIR